MVHAPNGRGGSWVALTTPFQDTGIEETALAALVECQINGGIAALVTCGSTGEALALRRRLLGSCASSCRLPPVVCRCWLAAPPAIRRGRLPWPRWLPRPAPMRCSARRRLFQADAGWHRGTHPHGSPCHRPTGGAYDVPGRVGVAIADATVARLFANELIVGIKDAAADFSRPPRLRALCGTPLLQLSGDDATAAAYRAMGGAGCISVTAIVAPTLCAAMHRAWDEGNLAEFARLRAQLDPPHAALFLEINSIPLKAALAKLGLCSDAVRLPLLRGSTTTVDRR